MQLFTFAQVAEVADAPVATVRSWFQQGFFGLKRGDQGAPVGGTRLLSHRTALALVVATALSRLGIRPALAAKAGVLFAHTGDPERAPGELFKTGETFLLVGSETAWVANMTSDTHWLEVMAKYRPQLSNGFHALALDELILAAKAKLEKVLSA